MRKNRLVLSLMFALTCGAVACGGAEDNLNDSTESLRRGNSSSDGGVRGSKKHDHDSDADVDEDSDESADGGKGHGRVSHKRGDGGTCSRGHAVRGERGRDHEDEDSKDDEDEEDDKGDEGGKGGLGGPHLDGGIKQPGKPGRDGGR